LPWDIEDNGAYFIVRDNNGQAQFECLLGDNLLQVLRLLKKSMIGDGGEQT